jgi:hypothetical protein
MIEQGFLRAMLAAGPESRGGVKVAIDVDPQGFLWCVRGFLSFPADRRSDRACRAPTKCGDAPGFPIGRFAAVGMTKLLRNIHHATKAALFTSEGRFSLVALAP